MTQNTTDLLDNGYHDNGTEAMVGGDSGNIFIDWISTWSYASENSERLMLYSIMSICLGLVSILLFIIMYLLCCPLRHSGHRHFIRPIFTKSSKRNLLSSTSTQTTTESAFLLSSNSPGVRSPGSSVDGPSPRLADPSSSPSTLRSLRVHSGLVTVGGEPVWTTLDRQKSVSPTVGLYTNPYRHDTFRTIDSRSSKSSPRK